MLKGGKSSKKVMKGEREKSEKNIKRERQGQGNQCQTAGVKLKE